MCDVIKMAAADWLLSRPPHLTTPGKDQMFCDSSQAFLFIFGFGFVTANVALYLDNQTCVVFYMLSSPINVSKIPRKYWDNYFFSLFYL